MTRQKPIDDFCISEDTIIIRAMKIMNEAGQRILFVVDEEQGFKGVLSAGDIRRAIVDNCVATAKRTHAGRHQKQHRGDTEESPLPEGPSCLAPACS